MSSFDTLMSGVSTGNQATTDPWGAPAATAATSTPGSGFSDLQGLQSGFSAPSPFQQPGFGAAQPFAAPGVAVPGMSAPAGNPFGPQMVLPTAGAAVTVNVHSRLINY